MKPFVRDLIRLLIPFLLQWVEDLLNEKELKEGKRATNLKKATKRAT